MPGAGVICPEPPSRWWLVFLQMPSTYNHIDRIFRAFGIRNSLGGSKILIFHFSAGSKLATAITQGAGAINKLICSGEVDELRDVIGLDDKTEEDEEDYLLDEGEVDYSKIPDVELPAPLASSKFAQNPDLLRTINQGGKRKLNHSADWKDSHSNENIGTVEKSSFSGMRAEFMYSDHLPDGIVHEQYNEDRSKSFKMKNVGDSQDISSQNEYQSSKTPNDSPRMAYIDERFSDDNLRNDTYSVCRSMYPNIPEEDYDLRRHWSKEKKFTTVKFDLQSRMTPKMTGVSQRDYGSHNPESMNDFCSAQTYHQNQSNTLRQCPQSLSGSISQIGSRPDSHRGNPHQNSSPSPRATRPPPRLSFPFISTGFRNPSNGSFHANKLPRQRSPFLNDNPFGRSPRPPMNFRYTGPNAESAHFRGSDPAGPNLRSAAALTDDYRFNLGGRQSFVSSTRGASTIHAPEDKQKADLNHRNLVRDCDQTRVRNEENY
ncbi:hypothetical protein QAD02_007491 [Eretmocerus hayati]|uniref:Uncharacterized protein n=1 Tax=Eretmocerus hayati TaxID=131215 RepID=A0ACC2N3Q6_9HYME|nr:hypothetical protein QAD02_007491 [Eretmocerus hayati]